MKNLVAAVGLQELVRAAGLEGQAEDFELVYSKISSTPSLKSISLEMEYRIRQYFSRLTLPNRPTIYDYLTLALREKDVIATFNWDPFLYYALERSRRYAPIPHWFYLHGCAILGCCDKCRQQGVIGDACPLCGSAFVPVPLLFPITEKDYTAQPYIEAQWNSLKSALKYAFSVTVFGYSAPSSDEAAIALMRDGWGESKERQFEELEFIDVLDQDTLRERWRPFIFPGHYHVVRDYFDSFLAKHTRRTCEAYWASNLEARFWEGNPVPRLNRLEDLWDWHSNLVVAEQTEGLT
jgi:hypothetical protein